MSSQHTKQRQRQRQRAEEALLRDRATLVASAFGQIRRKVIPALRRTGNADLAEQCLAACLHVDRVREHQARLADAGLSAVQDAHPLTDVEIEQWKTSRDAVHEAELLFGRVGREVAEAELLFVRVGREVAAWFKGLTRNDGGA